MSSGYKLKTHLLFLDGLRAIAALYVVMHHAVLQYYPGVQALTGIKKISLYLLFFGHNAVSLFIVLSGFCLMIPVIKNNYRLKKGAVHFFKKRVKRIIPPYFLAILFSLVLIWLFIGEKTGTHWDGSIPVTSQDVILHLLLINDLFTSHFATINHAFWSIPVECRIYLLFPVMIILWQKAGPYLTLLISLAFCIVMSVFLNYLNTLYGNINLGLSGVTPYLLLFGFGMLAADISLSPGPVSKLKDKLPWGILLSVSLVIYVLCLKAAGYYQIQTTGILYQGIDVAFGICCCCLIVFCSGRQRPQSLGYAIQRILCYPLLTFIGSFSYSIYLVHAPLLQLFTQYTVNLFGLSRYVSACVLITFGTASCVLVSYLFFIICEKPFMSIAGSSNEEQTEMEAIRSPAP